MGTAGDREGRGAEGGVMVWARSWESVAGKRERDLLRGVVPYSPAVALGELAADRGEALAQLLRGEDFDVFAPAEHPAFDLG